MVETLGHLSHEPRQAVDSTRENLQRICLSFAQFPCLLDSAFIPVGELHPTLPLSLVAYTPDRIGEHGYILFNRKTHHADVLTVTSSDYQVAIPTCKQRHLRFRRQDNQQSDLQARHTASEETVALLKRQDHYIDCQHCSRIPNRKSISS